MSKGGRSGSWSDRHQCPNPCRRRCRPGKAAPMRKPNVVGPNVPASYLGAAFE